MREHPNIAAARRRVSIARAEYRHEWDYGTPRTADEAYEKLARSEAAVDVYEMLRDHPDMAMRVGPGALERLIETRRCSIGNGLRLPRRS